MSKFETIRRLLKGKSFPVTPAVPSLVLEAKSGPSMWITLPTDSERTEQLRLKSQEYKDRVQTLSQKLNDLGNTSDTATGLDLLDQINIINTRVKILDKLVENGSVCMGDFGITPQDVHYGNPSPKPGLGKFLNAWSIIKDYAETGGRNIKGGNLPQVK